MDKALVFETKDCGFESHQVLKFLGKRREEEREKEGGREHRKETRQKSGPAPLFCFDFINSRDFSTCTSRRRRTSHCVKKDQIINQSEDQSEEKEMNRKGNNNLKRATKKNRRKEGRSRQGKYSAKAIRAKEALMETAAARAYVKAEE